METNRFFLTVNRINAVLLLLVLLAGGFSVILALLSMWGLGGWDNSPVAADPEVIPPKQSSLWYGNLQRIEGTSYSYIEVTTERYERKSLAGSLGSGGYGSDPVRNVMFINENNLEAHSLFENNDYVISEIWPVTWLDSKASARKTLALLFVVIEKDTDGDRTLSENDYQTIALTRPDGSGYREIATKVSALRDKERIAGNELLLMLSQDGKLNLNKYSLEDFSLVAAQAVGE